MFLDESYGGGPFQFGLVGIRLCFSVAENEPTDPLLALLSSAQCYVSSHRQPAEYSFLNSQTVQQSEEVLSEEFHRVLAIAHIALPESSNIISDDSKALFQELDLRVPHLMAQREAVNENDRLGLRVSKL